MTPALAALERTSRIVHGNVDSETELAQAEADLVIIHDQLVAAERDAEPDRVCHEGDGCPTEGAVLKRDWRRMRSGLLQLRAGLIEAKNTNLVDYIDALLPEQKDERSERALLETLDGSRAARTGPQDRDAAPRSRRRPRRP